MHKPLLKILTAALLCLSSFAPLHAELTNQLKQHPSPYLAMHGDDPVAWQTWNAQVLELARKTNKLVFISIGYFSCHWCHVMQRESYKDPAVAQRLNRDFIPVKVDRELDPALDAYLIDFVQKTRGYAGWPLNVFLTPEGHPVVGIVYLPNDQFRSLLNQLAVLWQKNSDVIRQTAAQASAQQQTESLTTADVPPVKSPLKLQPAMQPTLQSGIGKTLYNQLLQQILEAADDIYGGFGDQAKFPMPAQLNFLVARNSHNSSAQTAHFLQVTLEQMAGQGLRDHIGGGFFRYTIDPDWQTPHFEKMLYDNAQLAGLYLDAAKVFDRQDFEAIGRDTLDFMVRDMATENGGMVASLSAVDNNNIEGGYYLWTKEALQQQLTGEEYAIVHRLWNLEPASHFEAGYLPVYAISPERCAQELGKNVHELMSVLEKVRSKLYAARLSRVAPVDDKQLAAWNGLALSAMVKGAQLGNGDRYRQEAQKLRHFLVNQMWDGQRLARAKSGGKEIARAGLEDYAYAAQGLLRWARFSNSQQDLQLAKQWIMIAWQRFYSSSGWQLSDQPSLPGIVGRIVFEDNPMPSPAAVVIEVSLQLAGLTHDEPLKQRATTALAVSQELLKQQPFAYASQIELLARLQTAEKPE